MKVIKVVAVILCCATVAAAGGKGKKSPLSPLSSYLEKYSGAVASSSVHPSGSLWTPENPFTEMSSDYRARQVNDLVTIRIAEQTLAQSSADVTAQRKMQASSAITSVAGQTFGAVNPLLALNSDHELSGKGQADTQTRLETSLAGRVAAVLPNGVMVVEAERRVHMNNETQTIVLRGMVRPGDVQADNSVFSTSLANLEIELKGKGVVSDATRRSNPLLRALFWLTGF